MRSAEAWDGQQTERLFARTTVLSLFALSLLAAQRTIPSRSRSVYQSSGSDVAIADQSPLCGKPDDGQVHIPPDWTTFTPPSAGESYVDPVFGCTVKRLTDGSLEQMPQDGMHPSLTHDYSTFSPMNAADSMLFVGANNGGRRIEDNEGRIVVSWEKMPTMNNGHPVWDASDGPRFYYARGKTLYEGTVAGHGVKSKTLHTFREYRGIVSPDAADLSQDGDHIALVGQNANNTLDIFVWSLSKQANTLRYTTKCKIEGNVTETSQPGCLHKLQLTANNLLTIQFADNGSDSEQGLRLWDGNILKHLQDGTNHTDTGYDLKGNPVFIEVGRSSTLAGETNPCPSGWGLDVRQLNDTSSATCLLDKQPSWHVSYRGGASQPWVALSFFDDRKPGPELFNENREFQAPSSKNWQLYEDEIILARIDGAAIYRLTQARSRSAENYGAQPHAALSRDGKYVIFTSNMAHPNGCPARMHVPGECTDVYLIKVR
jgi:hypothetical protein